MSDKMVRWRLCLFMAILLILPDRGNSKFDDDDDDSELGESKKKGGNKRKNFASRQEDPDDDEEDDDDDDDNSPPSQKLERPSIGRRAPAAFHSSTPPSQLVTRTAPRSSLDCFVCAYKSETPLRSCLDPTKYRVHTMTCHSIEDKCFTSVIHKGNSYEAVMRGCRSGCVSSPETTCCELNRCNNQALAVPVVQPHVLTVASTDSKANSLPPSVLFFVTVLLALQTVVKVAVV